MGKKNKKTQRKHHACEANLNCVSRRGQRGAFMQANRAIICRLFTLLFMMPLEYLLMQVDIFGQLFIFLRIACTYLFVLCHHHIHPLELNWSDEIRIERRTNVRALGEQVLFLSRNNRFSKSDKICDSTAKCRGMECKSANENQRWRNLICLEDEPLSLRLWILNIPRNLDRKSGWDLGGREECEKFPDYHKPWPLSPRLSVGWEQDPQIWIFLAAAGI